MDGRSKDVLIKTKFKEWEFVNENFLVSILIDRLEGEVCD
jgi:hypothetical protein